MRVAIVHDWLYVVGGAERVLKEIIHCYPEADIYALFDFLTPEDRAKVGIRETKTSFLQRLPFVRRWHRAFLPLMPIAIEQLDLSEYDLVISSSYAVAKGVLTGPNQIHIAYVHSPMRYAWDLQHTYLAETGNTRGVKSMLMRYILHKMRLWDTRTANGPDVIVANSHFISRRIRKVYGRAAKVIYPPVQLSTRDIKPANRSHFLAASRLVPYKNIEAIVRAFEKLPDQKLIVAGHGPQAAHLKSIAGPNVTFAGFVKDDELRSLMASARAFVFAAEEDFGIVPVEAQSEGTPVLALRKGGSLETVIEKKTGLFFDAPEPDRIAATVRAFIETETEFSAETCRTHASRFAPERFRREIKSTVEEALVAFKPAVGPQFEQPQQLSARKK
ncbi:glycosyltransferase [Neorhizobium alkalisoli]|uniref:Glycosyltransferase involved in cell wall biosynthesis n=1 Tax=Neorhizobium alkalisoli TaxID=528178 RepID=A0A561R6M9_9HYPH|nr:glycosyltransferase [Neorhizobium alkalisoli]TWF58262.1 glycosyltransferase involved in cell wall biosynthesis [Neorhizobium alkalisoli]